MAQMGRPKIEIDWKVFDKLCRFQCTLVEIAEWFDCSEDTIERAVKREYNETFAERFKKKSAKGKTSLRRKMFVIAMKGNVTMCIWLSKQMLGYTDKVEQNVSSQVQTNVIYNTQFGNQNPAAVQSTANATESSPIQ